jgi:glutamyl-tRNA reductase
VSEILALGISHKTAPVAVRERVAFGERETERLLRELVGRDEVQEAVAITTCNRTELYLVSRDPALAEAELLNRLAERAGIHPSELAGVVYSTRNCDAARQLYRVTGGLDSMIVGEAEVQGQVKRAYELALGAGTTGPMTNQLFRAALQAGKRVRSETAIGRERTSVATVAVDLARTTVGSLSQRSVVVIGAGETSELTARALSEQGVRTIFIANRHADRARSLAERFGGDVGSLDELPARLEEADIVVASTASPHPIVGAEELELVMQARDRRPLVLIDIAVPRDIEPSCAEVEGAALYDIDDLQAVVARNLEVRESERRNADDVVEEEIQRFAARRHPHHRRAARARRRDRRSGAGRERRPLGVGLRARPGAHRGGRAVGDAATAARADDPPQDAGRGARARPSAAPARDVRPRGGLRRLRERRAGGRRPPGGQRPPPQAPGVRLGTRGSALALAQAGEVARALGGAELVTIVTSGDRDRARGDKERWVREIDAALLRGDIDLAVHSAKDVPGRLAEGIEIVAVPPRADPRDALCGAPGLGALAEGARVGTSSLRRAAQLRALRPDLEVTELRGNVDTRLRRLADGGLDAIVLARAGLERLGRGEEATATLDELVPAPGQGALAVTARAGDAEARAAAQRIGDAEAMACLVAERAVVRALEADCQTPVGAHAVRIGDHELDLRAFAGRPDGSMWVRDELSGADPEELGAEVARRLRAAGADEVLGR